MIHYILQIIGFQLVFLLVYEVFLKKETFFTWNRVYLLLTPLVSLVLPLLKIPVLQQSIPENYKIALPEVLTGVPLQETVLNGGQLAEVTITGTGSVNVYTILTNIWYVGVFMGVLFFVYKLYKIWNLSKVGTSRKIDGIRVITLPNSTTAFSFFNTMYLGANLSETQRKSIVMHEAVHIKERHSIDLLFFELLRIVFWFNPLVYIYQKELTLLQEFQADATAVLQTDKAKYYQELLARVFQTEKISFINTFFNHSFIKKRITMLQKSKSKNLARLKYVLLIPVMASMLFYVACSGDNSGELEEIAEIAEGNNLYVSYGKFGSTDALTIAVKDITLLTKKEQMFVELAKYEEGFKDIKRGNQQAKGEEVFSDMDELFFVNYTKRLQAVANSSEVVIDKLEPQFETWKKGEGEKPKGKLIYEFSPEKTFYERESKYIDFDDAHAVPYAVIEKVPTYPGCSGSTNEELKRCMSDKIAKTVNRNFNTELGRELGLTGINRIFVSFVINKSGEIVNIRSRAPHPGLETEAERVIKALPKMKPGEQKGEPVDVLYSLPITFKIQE